MKFSLEKYNVPENEYLESLREALSRMTLSGEVIIVGLCPKLGEYTDPMMDAPVFVYNADNKDVYSLIMSWAKEFSEKAYVLPKLRIKYLIATMPAETLVTFIEGKNNQEITDMDFLTVLNKYKAFVEEGQQD
jgi:hypothetical protein